jgi:1-aminocyclopropane-1-carboxylate deaminase/D-cysteine desulfhydrase-like pyridoxal-dependent ACC family enzyme
VLLACGVLAVFAMAHHPSVESHSPAEAIREIGRVGTLNLVVHAAMIAIVAALLFAFAVFSLRRGIANEAVLGALVAQAIGSAAMIVAAMISGFVIPDIAARYAHASADGMTFAVQVIAIGAGVNQAFARLGVIGMSLAIVLWSADLVRTPGFVRITGALGFVAGALAGGVLVLGGRLTPLTLGIVVLGQAIWYCAVGVLLVREVL